jgi:cardiolipin synthase
MLEAVAGAKHHIHLETYILRSDGTGARFVEALTRQARDGVRVCLLYDAVGSRGLDETLLEPLRRAGGDVISFNPLRWTPPFALRRRDHRKILVVDGKLAFTGGLNVGDEYHRGFREEDGGWRDAHVRVRGPAVRYLEAVFLESWFRADGPDLPWHTLLDTAAEAVGGVRCAVLPDGPVYRRRRVRDLLISALEQASDHVRLVSPYFAPGRRVLDALARASDRGVEIDLLLAGVSDHPVLRRAARSIVSRLIASGVRVHEYHRGMMHAKVAVLDDQWAIVGSSNLDRQSFEHSYEVNLVMEGIEVARRLRKWFDPELSRCVRIDEESLAARGPWERLLDRLSAFVVRWT